MTTTSAVLGRRSDPTGANHAQIRVHHHGLLNLPHLRGVHQRHLFLLRRRDLRGDRTPAPLQLPLGVARREAAMTHQRRPLTVMDCVGEALAWVYIAAIEAVGRLGERRVTRWARETGDADE